MFNFNGMPYKRSGRAGGKSVSMIGMLVLLLAALLVLPSCFGDDETVTETVTETVPETVTEIVEPPLSCDELGQTGGDDTLQGSSGEDDICALGGDDTITASGGDDMIDAGDGDDTVYAGDGRDSVVAGAGDDTVEGGDGDDMIDGGDGDDTLSGGRGEDTIMGGAGADVIEGGRHDDTIDGGDGNDDTASYKNSDDKVDVSLAEAIDSRGDAARDTLTNIENLIGSDSEDGDTLTGNGEDNTLTGGGGPDTLNGGGGDDTLIGGATTVDALNGGDDADTASWEDEKNIEDDPDTETVMETYVAKNVEVDISKSPVGDPPVFTATYDGVASDTIATVEVTDENDVKSNVSTIENFTGGDGDDTFTGDAGNNVLNGGDGKDTLDGGGGDDVLVAGPGGVSSDLESLTGGDGDDMLTGVEGYNDLNGGAGSDTIYAGANDAVDGGSGPAVDMNDDGDTDDPGETDTGVDTVSYKMVTKDTDTTNAEGTLDGVTVDVGSSTFANVEKLIGSPLNDTITSSTASIAMIMGGDGNDVITGGNGRDMILGGDGKDTLNGGGGGITPPTGFDKAMADVLAGMGGDDTLSGSDSSTDVFAVHTGGGDDTITDFELGVDHVHFLGFTAADVDCQRARGSVTKVVCTAGSQTVDIEIEAGETFSTDPEDLTKDLNIVIDPNG